MSTTNGGPAPAQNPQPQLNVVAQYIKDFSFENPNAPQSLTVGTQPPQIGIQINVNAKPLSDNDIEVTLKLDGKAETDGKLIFRFELEYAGIFQFEPENQFTVGFRLAVKLECHLDVVVRQRLGVDVDLNADLRRLRSDRQRLRRVRVLEREILDVLRHHVELRLRVLGRCRAAIGRGHENSLTPPKN